MSSTTDDTDIADEADATGRGRYLKNGAERRFLRVQLANYLKNNPIRPIA